MNKRIAGIFTPKIGLILALAAAAVLVIAPRVKDKAAADVIDCPVLATQATISQLYPVSTNSPRPACTDRPAIAAFDGSNYYNNVNAQPGDVLEIDAYIHNEAADGSPDATDVNVNINVVTVAGSSHSISMNATSANAGALSGAMTINTPDGATLEIVPGSAHIEDFYGSYDGSGSIQQSSNGVSAHFGSLGACFQFSKFIVFQVRVVGQQQVTPTAEISAQLGAQVQGQCLWNATVTWSTSNVDNVRVYVKSVNDGNGEKLMAAATEGNNNVDWIDAGDVITFILRGDNIPDKTAVIDTRNLSCEQPQNYTVNLSMNSAEYCVYSRGDGQNQTPTYTVTGSQNLAGKEIVWSSTKNGVPTGEANSYYGHNLDGNAYWSGPADGPWTVSNIGTWTKTASIFDPVSYKILATSQPFQFKVKDCSQQVQTLTCSANVSWVYVNQSVTFTANGGNAPYNWSNGGSPATGSGASFGTSFSTSGSKTVRVASSDGQVANCSVEVKVVPPQTLTCSSNVSSINVNQTVSFTATGGNAPYNWSNGENPATGSGQSFSTSYSTGGTKTVRVASSDGQVANCSVYVNQPTQNLTCSANVSSADINQPVTFTATGGNGVFNWNSNGNPATGSGPNYTVSYSTGGTKTATVSNNIGQTAQCSVNIAQPPAALVCVANYSAVDINQPVMFTASGGNAPYNWSNGGNPATGSGQSFYTTYSTSGTKTVRVASSDGQVANCSVIVKTITPQTLVCSAVSSAVDIGKPATFVATGGNAPYNWSGNGSPATGSGSSFSTTYSASGLKSVTVNSADGQTAQCSVTVNTPPVQPGVIVLSKQVKNITQGGSFGSNASAKTGDVMEYKITVAAGTSVALKNVVVTDTYNNGLVYNQGTLTVNGSPHETGLTSGGLIFPQVDQNPIVIKYQSTVTASSGSIVNTAQASAENAPTVTSQALVNVVFVQPGQPALAITKTASVSNAKKGDTINYQIVVKNVGQADAKDVYISDSMPSIYRPMQDVNISKSTGGNWPDGISLPVMAPGDTITITYSITVNQESGTIVNTATASASNAATVSASAIVNINTTTTPGGNTTISNSYNTYNSCVNNSCNTTNTYYITTAGTQVPVTQVGQLAVSKAVRNAAGGVFAKSATATSGQNVEFEIIVTNIGSVPVNNVVLNDTWSGGLGYLPGSTLVDGVRVGEIWTNNNLPLGSLAPGQQKRVLLSAVVNAPAGGSIQNVAVASGANVPSVQSDAWVFVGGVAGGNVSIVYNKKAFNETKGVDATTVPASKEDFIVYTLTATNNGNTPAQNFTITDDLSHVLPYADIVDSQGGVVNGSIITFPGLAIPPGGYVSKSFRVRIKYFLADNLNYVMTNTYGNTVTININTPQVKGAFIAPKTGASTNMLVFSGMLTAGFAVFRKRKHLADLMKLVFNA